MMKRPVQSEGMMRLMSAVFQGCRFMRWRMFAKLWSERSGSKSGSTFNESTSYGAFVKTLLQPCECLVLLPKAHIDDDDIQRGNIRLLRESFQLTEYFLRIESSPRHRMGVSENRQIASVGRGDQLRLRSKAAMGVMELVLGLVIIVHLRQDGHAAVPAAAVIVFLELGQEAADDAWNKHRMLCWQITTIAARCV